MRFKSVRVILRISDAIRGARGAAPGSRILKSRISGLIE